MKYHGGKAKRALGKALGAILTDAARERKRYLEPFCGSGAVLVNVSHPNRVASDLHPDLMLLLEAVRDGWKPPRTVSERTYSRLRNEVPSALRGFVGFGCSFGGKWFGGYARGALPTGVPRNYADETRRALLRDAPKLAGVDLVCCDYTRWKPGRDTLVYCDPPYGGTTGFGGLPPFDTARFWLWATAAARSGADVFVSEEAAPPGWEVVWEKAVVRTTVATKQRQHVATERLFRYGGR